MCLGQSRKRSHVSSSKIAKVQQTRLRLFRERAGPAVGRQSAHPPTVRYWPRRDNGSARLTPEVEGYTNTAPSCVAFRHLILHLRLGAPLAVTNPNSRGTWTEASTTDRTPETDISAMTHWRSAIPPIPIHAPDPELPRGEERLSFPFRLKIPPKLTFFIIIAPSSRLNAACGRLCCRDALYVLTQALRNRCSGKSGS